jgi:hypothetical protein
MASILTRGFKTGAAITKSDAVPQDPVIAAFMVTGAGNVVLQSRGNPGPVTIACVVGTIYEIEAEWIYNATTATGIVSLVKA